jgi:hypothetical protein
MPPGLEGLLTASTQTVPLDGAAQPSSHVERSLGSDQRICSLRASGARGEPSTLHENEIPVPVGRESARGSFPHRSSLVPGLEGRSGCLDPQGLTRSQTKVARTGSVVCESKSGDIHGPLEHGVLFLDELTEFRRHAGARASRAARPSPRPRLPVGFPQHPDEHRPEVRSSSQSMSGFGEPAHPDRSGLEPHKESGQLEAGAFEAV